MSYGLVLHPVALSCVLWPYPPSHGPVLQPVSMVLGWVHGGHRSLFCNVKQNVLTIWNSSADLPDPVEVVALAAVRDIPSTRTGGQDGVSS